MWSNEFAVLIGVGILFILFGVVGIVWGMTEERKYYNGLSSRRDVREYMERWPPRPGLGAVKVGGWIALAEGLVLVIVGTVYIF